MKNLFVFIFLSILLIFSCYSVVDNFNVYSLFDVLQIQIFTSNKNDTYLSNVVDNGRGEIYYCSTSDFLNVYNSINYISGYCVVVNKGNEVLQDFVSLLNINIVEKSENNLYGYSANFPYRIQLHNKMISVQILEKDDKFFIGTPILLGSY